MSVGQFVPGVSPADVSAAIAAAITAYESTDVGVRPVQTITRTLLDNKAAEQAMNPAIVFPGGSLGASGVWSITRGSNTASGMWKARWDLNGGEILMEGLTPLDLGVEVFFYEDFGAGALNTTYTTTATGDAATLVLEVWKIW